MGNKEGIRIGTSDRFGRGQSEFVNMQGRLTCLAFLVACSMNGFVCLVLVATSALRFSQSITCTHIMPRNCGGCVLRSFRQCRTAFETSALASNPSPGGCGGCGCGGCGGLRPQSFCCPQADGFGSLYLGFG